MGIRACMYVVTRRRLRMSTLPSPPLSVQLRMESIWISHIHMDSTWSPCWSDYCNSSEPTWSTRLELPFPTDPPKSMWVYVSLCQSHLRLCMESISTWTPHRVYWSPYGPPPAAPCRQGNRLGQITPTDVCYLKM